MVFKHFGTWIEVLNHFCFHGRDVGFTRRFISCHGVVRLGLPDGLLWVYGTVHCWFLSKV